MSNRQIIVELINLIKEDKLLKYKLSSKIITIKLIDLTKEARATSLEFLYLFKNFKIVNKSSKVNKIIELIYLLNRIFNNLRF